MLQVSVDFGGQQACQQWCSPSLLVLTPVGSWGDWLAESMPRSGPMGPWWVGSGISHHRAVGQTETSSTCHAERTQVVCVVYSYCPFSKLTDRHLNYFKKVPLYHMTFFRISMVRKKISSDELTFFLNKMLWIIELLSLSGPLWCASSHFMPF